MSNQSQNKRLYLINRDFQMRYTGAAIVIGCISTILTTALILFPLYQFEILRTPKFLPVPVLLMMCVAAAINVLLIGLLGVFITHRIAGPMYSLVRRFRMIEEGGEWKGDVKLRQDDDLRYVIRNFNGMVEAMVGMLHEDLELIESVKSSLQDSEDEDCLAQALQSIQSLESNILARIPSKSDHSQ